VGDPKEAKLTADMILPVGHVKEIASFSEIPI
jgi:hypothetical protein